MLGYYSLPQQGNNLFKKTFTLTLILNLPKIKWSYLMFTLEKKLIIFFKCNFSTFWLVRVLFYNDNMHVDGLMTMHNHQLS